ncbi:MAG TPA: hypothetical protein VG273_22280 [Bryobacteraceae bacterium]|nr:hypothetical protein [Bryobacteraceae bacterium]
MHSYAPEVFDMTLTPLVVAWAVLAIGVIGLAIFRSIAGLHEDDNVHLAAGEQDMIPKQIAFFNTMERIDRWGKSLTVVTAAFGLVLASIYIYHSLQGRF